MARQLNHIVNLHAGRHADSKTQRYKRMRYADSAPDDHGDDDDYYDWYDDHWDRREPADDLDIHEHTLRAIQESLCPTHRSLLRGVSAAKLPILRSGAAHPDPDLPGIPKHDLPMTVASHLDVLLPKVSGLQAEDDDPDEYLLEKPTSVLAGLSSVEATAAHDLIAGCPWLRNAVITAVLFQPFWIRRLSAWSPPKGRKTQRQSLVDHLFVRYPVPPCLYGNWHHATRFPRLKWVCWFVLLAQGASIRSAASLFHWRVPGKLTGMLHQAPPHLGAGMGAMWAEVQRLGGDETVFARLTAHHGFSIDVTSEGERNKGFHSFWQSAVHWLARNGRVISDAEANMVLEWAWHMWTEACADRLRYNRDINFSLKGWGRERALSEAEEYRMQRLSNRRPKLTWDSHGWDWQAVEADSGDWTVTELLSSSALHEESEIMHHCVQGYDHRCAQGYCAIFSLQNDGDRVLTIECDAEHKALIQIRGHCNREATAQEMCVVSKWWKEVQDRGCGHNEKAERAID